MEKYKRRRNTVAEKVFSSTILSTLRLNSYLLDPQSHSYVHETERSDGTHPRGLLLVTLTRWGSVGCRQRLFCLPIHRARNVFNIPSGRAFALLSFALFATLSSAGGGGKEERDDTSSVHNAPTVTKMTTSSAHDHDDDADFVSLSTWSWSSYCRSRLELWQSPMWRLGWWPLIASIVVVGDSCPEAARR